MSVKVGVGFGGWPFPDADPENLWEYVDACEALGIDSIWLSDRIVSEVLSLEPLIALSFIAARTKKLKFGTSVLALPLRNPTVLAKEIATLDFLSGGRVLPAVGLGTEDEREFEACGSLKRQRAGRTDEAIEVMKLLWSQDNVTFHGKYYTLNNVTIQPKPVQKSLPPMWIGGRSEAAIRRTARIGDGWLVSQATPDEVSEGVAKIKVMAQEHGNEIEDDHYGVLFSFFIADTQEEAARQAAPYMLRRRTDVDYAEFSAFGTPDHVKALMDRYIDAGAPKIVVRPACAPELMMEQLELLGREVVPHYHGKKEAGVA
ncbi:MAG: LLM class flavin-dependent oxidoreductase [Chloroflexi bacterium]|nr:LLM class flavin-dependent oxidoreductase [Chloroflexota bacterium]